MPQVRVSRSVHDTHTVDLLFEVASLNDRGIELAEQRRYHEALVVFREGLLLASRHSFDLHVLWITRNIARTYKHMGDYEHAIAYYRKSLALAEPGSVDRCHIHTGMALSLLELGLYRKALSHFTAAYRISSRLGDTRSIADCLTNLGLAYCKVGCLEKARELMELALTHYFSIGYLEGLAYSYTELAKISCGQGQIARGLHYAREAMMLAADLKDELELARALVASAMLYRKNGNNNKSRSYLRQAYSIFSAYQDPAGLAECLSLMQKEERRSKEKR